MAPGLPALSALSALLASIDAWQVAAVLAKLATYGSCFFASGGVFFLALFRAQLTEVEQRLIRRTVALAALLAMAVSLARLGIVNGMLSGEWSGMVDLGLARMVLATREGPALLLRAVGLGLVALPGSVAWRRRPLAMPLLGAVLATLSFGVVGHADELYPLRAVSVAHGLIALHLLAVAFWLGALWPLYWLLGSRCARNSAGHDMGHDPCHGLCQRATRSTALVARFGQIAVVMVTLLVLAGGTLLWLLLGSFNALWQTSYGLLMLAKLAAVAGLLALAALNKLRFTPRLLRGDPSARPALRRAIAAEMAVAGLILLATAALTTLAGPPALG